MSSQNLSSRLISSRLSSRLSSTSGHESDTGYLTAPESYSYDTSQLRIPPQYLTSRLSSGSSRLFSDNPQIPEYEVVPTEVVMGATTVQTNQRAAFRSRGTNGPISVQNEIT